MKKIMFLLVVFASLASITNAQIVTSDTRRRVEVEKEPSESMWYARFGLNMMKCGGDVSDFKDYIKSNLGYQIVWGFEKPLGPLFWGMEFGLGSRGFKLKEDNYEFKVTAHNAVFSPFNIGYKHPITDDLSVEAHIGAYVAGDYFGKIKETDGNESDDWSIYDAEDYTFPDAGMQFGFGVWYSSIGLDLLFQKGFLNWTGDLDADAKLHTSNFMVRLGVKF